MPRKYAIGSKALFICARCGQRGLYRASVFDGYYPSLRVHPECFEDKHPQERLTKVSDPIALWKPFPEWGGSPSMLSGVANTSTMSIDLSWTEAEIFNARFESYDVYRAVVDSVTGEPGAYELLVVLPIVYDEFMAIVSQTLTYSDSSVSIGVTYAYKVVANASN